ncbi:MAG: bifunctional demethylmenaquinone methyltransferase/2-methoxy-6-polyprenyl-1,4-benzoquinol methylase UbiE [Muribaculaceae bacterium]|nr:bifunctional demethylmenaquinone methyltransferase/2-methoxy-6-polyprenyl-1,4-benzoquinol methylase UbiE [Muribaculaceae bacterium]MDE6552168.1 bifunctional demethylmenaquinone methyltransferase/2-methoxy-6-polyprenyl-1,4-benzoquinol methylase UbiE [Muribaculaceae bacterium]
MERAEEIKPYNDEEAKGKQVGEMFDAIAPSYDFMNTMMTGGLHIRWRNKALKMAAARLHEGCPERVLDVACGTGDVSFRLHELFPKAHITGLDLSPGMLSIAEKKLAIMDEETRKHINFIEGDSLKMPFADDTFDMVTVAYGVRNFERLEDGYREMRRVLKPGGVLCVIELSEPANPLIRSGYRLYSRNVIPLIGRMVSHDTRAYSYLPESIAACPQRGEMTAMMERAGFREATYKSLTMGVITIYIALA